MFQAVVHVDDTLLAIFSECLPVFFDDERIPGIFHTPG
jgi:hypothetical protein